MEDTIDYEMTNEGDSQLDIEVNSYGNSKDTTTSLCDRFGIYIYSDEFLEKEEAYKKYREEQDEDIISSVFSNQKRPETEDAFYTVMNAETGTVLKTEYETESNKAASPFSMYAYVLMGILIAGVLLFFIDRQRRKRAGETEYDDH